MEAAIINFYEKHEDTFANIGLRPLEAYKLFCAEYEPISIVSFVDVLKLISNIGPDGKYR